MVDLQHVWIERDRNIRDIVNEEMIVHIEWSKVPSKDYFELSTQYIHAGYQTLKEILQNSHSSNIMFDMWFLPSVYMIRQAIELLLKAGLAVKVATKKELQDIFVTTKHDLKKMYDIYKERYGLECLCYTEQKWLEDYLDSIEVVDSSSNLFRYPFKDNFMKQYGERALDIASMSNRLLFCYTTLHKMIYGDWFEEIKLNIKEKTDFLHFSSSSINNCYLYDSPYGDGFHKQIVGYSEVSKFLFENFVKTKNVMLFYPMVFLLRNAIELGLKRILHMRMYYSIDNRFLRGKKNSHLLYKDLWKSIKPVLVHYSELDNQDKDLLDLAESYIVSFNSLDKNGDIFRYPCSYSNEYKFNKEKIDVENFLKYLLGIFNFIDGCASWLNEIKDYEMEMKSFYDH